MAGGDHDAAGSLALANQSEIAGVGQGLSVSQTGVPVELTTSATAAATSSRSIAVVVADQHAFARIFAAHHVARDRLRHDARVGKVKSSAMTPRQPSVPNLIAVIV